MASFQKKYTAMIIGAGNIGSLWDVPRSRSILTYAHAFGRNRRTVLKGIVDTDAGCGKREAKRWKTDFYPDVAAGYTGAKPDIVVIATPDTTHAPLLENLLSYEPKLILCEKPIVTSMAEAEKVKNLLKEVSTSVIVNFPREFDDAMLRLQKELLEGRHGKIISVHATYAKGIHHIGSHLFHLLRFLFGELTSASAHFKIDEFPNDPTYGGVATFERSSKVHIECMDSRVASTLELEIFTEKRRIRLSDRGYLLETQEPVPDPVFSGFKKFGKTKTQRTKLDRALPALIEHAVAVLDGRDAARSSAGDALKTFDACETFAASYRPIYHS